MQTSSELPIEKAIAAVILRRRIELGYSQEYLANLAGLHRTFLSDIERGARPNITLTTLARFAECLKVLPSRLVADAEEYLLAGLPESERLALLWQEEQNQEATALAAEKKLPKKQAEYKAPPSRPLKQQKHAKAKLPKSSLAGSLAEKYPEIAAQWHPRLNGSLKPHRILPQSTLEIWWQCPRNDSHSWQAQMSRRIDHGKNCPLCKD